MLLCRIYEENGPVEYHVARLAAYCGCREKELMAVVDRLLVLDRIKVTDGKLWDDRAEREIAERNALVKSNSQAGKASAEKRQQNQRKQATPVQQPFNHSDTDTEEEEEGGGGSASEALTFREKILAAVGADPVSGMIGPNGKRLGSQADMIAAGQWLGLGLTEPEVLAEISALIAAKRDGPPGTFGYFTAAMARLAAAKSAPPPELPQFVPPKGNRKNGIAAFDRAINELADGLSAGTVQLDTDSRNPFASRSG